jgi:hypothetical protein
MLQMKGIFGEENLTGSLIGASRELRALAAFSKVQTRSSEKSPVQGEHFFVTNIFLGPNSGIFLNVNEKNPPPVGIFKSDFGGLIKSNFCKFNRASKCDQGRPRPDQGLTKV